MKTETLVGKLDYDGLSRESLIELSELQIKLYEEALTEVYEMYKNEIFDLKVNLWITRVLSVVAIIIGWLIVMLK